MFKYQEELKRMQNRNIIINEIIEAFDNYLLNQKEPNFELEVHLNVLIDFGLVEKKKATTESTNKAYNRLLVDNTINKLERKKMIEEMQHKRKTHKLEMEAQRIENNQTIKNYFDLLISEKKDIRTKIKKVE